MYKVQPSPPPSRHVRAVVATGGLHDRGLGVASRACARYPPSDVLGQLVDLLGEVMDLLGQSGVRRKQLIVLCVSS
jgi:hypothetical protein